MIPGLPEAVPVKRPGKLPFAVQASVLLMGLYVLVLILSATQRILLPVLYAVILAILLSPVITFLVSKKLNRVVAIAGVLSIVLLAFMGIILLVSTQADRLNAALPYLGQKLQALLDQTTLWASSNSYASEKKIDEWLLLAQDEITSNGSSIIGSTLSTVGGVLTAALLTPVYIFMILFYQPHLVRFVHQLFGSGNNQEVGEVLNETKAIVRSYLTGLSAEFAILAVLKSAGLLLLGIDYAILLGIIGALLNIIPYLGGIAGVALFASIALITKPPVYVLYVILLYGAIQFIDNNYIVPKIIGSKVKLNALISLFVVIAGAALWGIPGMFLSIPLTAIIKLVLDRIESLKPWGFLLGDTMPPLVKLKK